MNIRVQKRMLVFALVMVILAGIFYKPIFSYDIWLHLKMGEYIAEHDYVLPEADPFSYTTEGKSLILHEWLSQLILYFVHKAFGFSGLRIMRVLLELAGLALIFRAALRLCGRFPAAFLVLLATAYLYRTRYLMRPELFSLLFFTMFYTWFITAHRRATVLHYVLFFIVCVLWINLHPFMIFTGIVIAVLSAARIAVKLRPFNEWFRGTDLPFDPNILLLLFLAASLMNPYGYHIYGYVFDTTPIVKELIREWQSIFVFLQADTFKSVTGGVLAFPLIMKGSVIGITIAFLGLLAGSYVRKIRWSIEDILIGLLMTYMAITAARFAWLLFVPILLIVKYGRLHIEKDGVPARFGPVMSAALWVAVSICSVYWAKEGYLRIPYNLGHEIEVNNYPDVPVRILRETNLTGRLYNPAAWGGYLAYHLYPGYKIFLDTDTYLHGAMLVLISNMIQFEYQGFEKLIDKYEFDVLLFKKVFGDRRPVVPHDWTLIFENINSAIYLRNNARNAANLEKIVEYYRKNNVPFDPEKGFDIDLLRRDRSISDLYRLN